MNLAILGPQGSGKGTQAERLVDKFGWLHIETGKILRNLVKTNHPLAKDINELMNQGLLVSDEVLSQVLDEQIKKEGAKRGILFDGSPRNLAQYGLIKKLLKERGEKLDKVVYIKISKEESLRRMSSRRTCERCGEVFNLLTNPAKIAGICDTCKGQLRQRADDQPEAIEKRLNKFREATIPVIEQAAKEKTLVEIEGEKPIEEVFNDIVKELGL